MKKIIVNEQKICKNYQKGESALTLERKFNINYRTVYRILERNGIRRRDNREKTLNAAKHGRDTHTDKWRKIAIEQWKGKGNPRWKPIGTKRQSHEYILLKTRYGWVNEEREVARQLLGRKLKKWETIHHINGIKNDNRPENLHIMTRKQHKAFHTVDNVNNKNGIVRIELKSNLNN